MAWRPIALTVPQYHVAGVPASGYVLKPYAAGTSTAINFATGSTGATEVGSVALNSAGYPEVSGNVVIPHIDQDYKLMLYPTQAAADANSGEIWSVDNLSPAATFNNLTSVAGTNTITATASPTLSSYTVNDRFWLIPANKNNGAVTLNIDSVGSGAVQLGGAALAGGELQANVPVQVQVTAATPVFEIVSNGNMLPAKGGENVGVAVMTFASSHASSILMYGETVGDAGSGGDLADAKYEELYAHLWDNVADSEAAVSTGRGASAAADWAAGKTITVPDMRGRTPIGKDNMGGSSANVITDSEADTIADLFGEEDHTPIEAEMFAHLHDQGTLTGKSANTGGGAASTNVTSANTESGTQQQTISGNVGTTGSSTAFNILQPGMTWNYFIRY